MIRVSKACVTGTMLLEDLPQRLHCILSSLRGTQHDEFQDQLIQVFFRRQRMVECHGAKTNCTDDCFKIYWATLFNLCLRGVFYNY